MATIHKYRRATLRTSRAFKAGQTKEGVKAADQTAQTGMRSRIINSKNSKRNEKQDMSSQDAAFSAASLGSLSGVRQV